MNEHRPYFVSVMDETEDLTLYVREGNDRDYLYWGEVTERQLDILFRTGVMELEGGDE